MLSKVIDFLKGIPSHERPAAALADDPRVAAGALMFHVVNADGVRDAAEARQLREALSRAYELHGRELERILSAAEEAEREAVDLYAFTSVLNRHLSEDERVRFVGILWEMVYADGERHELEDNVVWRVAELIGVSDRDRVTQRRKVKGRLEGE